jgi:hypothetical protein
MDITKLNVSFDGANRAEVDAVLKNAEIIIPYFEFKETKSEGSAFSITSSMQAETVISFVGMLQTSINTSGGSVTITDTEGDTVQLSKGKSFNFLDLEKLLKPVM